jgi:iron complex outermembrane receptor protein
MTPPLSLSRLALATALAGLVPTAAFARDNTAPALPAAPASDADTGEVITVTARHRDEKLQDVPIAISTLDGKALAVEHLDRVGDYAIKIPNFSALQQNTRVSGLSIRGLGGNASNDGAEGGVGLIVDNVFFTHVGFSWLDFVDLEGSRWCAAPGHAAGQEHHHRRGDRQDRQAQLHPRSMCRAPMARAAWQVRSNATGPLIADKLAYRLTFATSQGGGWITNAYDGNKYLNNNRWSVRGQLLYTPAPNITDRLIAEHYETHEYNNFYPAQSDVNQNLNLDGSVLSQRAGSWTNKLISRFGYTPSFNVTANANMDNQQRLVSRTDGVSNEVNIEGGAVDVTSVTAWRRLYFRPYNDGDYTPLAIDRSGYDVNVNQYSQELLRLEDRRDDRLARGRLLPARGSLQQAALHLLFAGIRLRHRRRNALQRAQQCGI